MGADAMEVEATPKKEDEAKDQPPPPDPVGEMRTELKAALSFVERFVATRESRFIVHALKLQGIVRKKAKANPAQAVSLLTASVASVLTAGSPLKPMLLQHLGALPSDPMPVAEAEPAAKPKALPETEILVSLQALLFLLDLKQGAAAVSFASELIARVATFNRRTLDFLSERVFFYASWAYECHGDFASLRSTFLAAHRTACLHHNAPCQATLLNLLLRNYQHYKLYDQADKLLARTTFPDSASAAQLARFLYYTGRIKALQLEYTEAHRCLLQAQRKAPQARALGFRLAVHKLGTIVQLLLGEIPDRAVFRHPSSRALMLPYLHIVQAVRTGSLAAFKAAMDAHEAVYVADNNATLVLRLRQNVIRAGLRNISLSYSRIGLADVATKLALDHPEDMESIAAKAIRDGVIDATIDHAAGVLLSNESADVYSTLEPQAAFHKRITFCLNLHNDSLKAMAYPPDAHKGDLPDAQTLKERQREENELAQQLAEEEEEDF